MKNRLTITPLLVRVVVFLAVFGCITGLVGPRIIASDIFFEDGFDIYGGLGKALIFGGIVFALLVRRRAVPLKLEAWNKQLSGWIALTVLLLVIAWSNIDELLVGERHFANLFLAHSGLLLSVLSAGLAVFGHRNLGKIWQAYRQEAMLALGLMAAFYVFLQTVYLMWEPLASVVLVSVKFLLEVSGLDVALYPPQTLILDKFGITVAEFCSGVESIALFTSLYVLMGVLDWPRLHRRRYYSIFPLALLILCGLNIMRVYGLIMAGYYIDPEIAFSLFHTYAGMIFFVIYSLIFWMVSYRYIVPGKKRA